MELKDGKKHTCGLRRPFGVAGMTNSINGENGMAQWLGQWAKELGSICLCQQSLLTSYRHHLWLQSGDIDTELHRSFNKSCI